MGRNKCENELAQPTHTTASSIINEQFQLKQLMMEKQLELLHKQVISPFFHGRDCIASSFFYFLATNTRKRIAATKHKCISRTAS